MLTVVVGEYRSDVWLDARVDVVEKVLLLLFKLRERPGR